MYGAPPERQACECEHIDHMGDEPDGCTHAYGAACLTENMTVVDTAYGKFTVCKPCAETHLADFNLDTE